MKKVIIFGKPVTVIVKNSKRDAVRLRKNKLFVYSHKKAPSLLIKEYLSNMLYEELYNIYEKIKRDSKIQIIGSLDFDIVEKIDGRKDRIAKLKGNVILIRLDVIGAPKRAIKYIVCHELAHTLVKRHTKKFWKILETIYPNYKIGEKLMIRYGKLLHLTKLS